MCLLPLSAVLNSFPDTGIVTGPGRQHKHTYTIKDRLQTFLYRAFISDAKRLVNKQGDNERRMYILFPAKIEDDSTSLFRRQHRRRLCVAVRHGELTCRRETAINVWLHCSCPALHYTPCERGGGNGKSE